MRLWTLILLLVSFTGCASVPAVSVELSVALGKMIVKARESHINLANKHFDRLVDDADKFMLIEYKPAFLDNLRKILKREDPNFQELTVEQYDKAMERLVKIRLGWVNDIQKARRELLVLLDDFYADMVKANVEITGFLSSAAKVNKSHSNLLDAFDDNLSQKTRELEEKLLESAANIETMLANSLQSIN